MRHTVIGFLAASILLACGGAALAQTTSPPADPPASPAAAPAEDKMVCIDQDAGGNSRLGTRKVCHTQKEWDALPRARR